VLKPDQGYFLNLGSQSRSSFMCHLDTVGTYSEPVRRIVDGDFIKTDGKTILGADDRAGITVLLYMIAHGIPGRYCFFFGEEKGCIGSGNSANDLDFWKDIDRCISFDRAGYTDVITHQTMGRTASDNFAMALSRSLNSHGMAFRPNDEGMYTDSREFSGIIPECTNLSVGYFGAHTNYEKQDVVFLEQLCKAVVRVDWESLPVSRDPSVIDYDDGWRSSSRYGGSSSFYTTARSCPNREFFSDNRQVPRNLGSVDLNSFNPFSRIEMALIFNETPTVSDVREALSIDPDRLCELMLEYGVWRDTDDGV